MKVMLLYFFSALLLFANSKTENLSSDETVKKSERQAIVSLSRLGMSNYSYNLTASFCPEPPKGKERKCFPMPNWEGSFSQLEIDELLSKDLNQLVSKRYDVIKFVGSRAIISTATKNLSENIHKEASFSFKTGSEDTFQEKTLSYLNHSNLEKILSLSTDTRYNEMSDVERMSFLRTKGKETGIPFEIAEKLVNSAYAFSLYYGKIEGSVKVLESVKTINGETIISYTSNFDIPADMTLFVNKFDGKSFKLYNRISTDRKDSIIGKFSPSLAQSTDYKPSSSDSKQILTSVFTELFKENLIALNTKLKEDRNFKIISPIEKVDGKSIEIAIGCQQDIRVDHPFKVARDVNGEEKELGFFKVRKSGKNCLLMPEEDRENSIGETIKGKFESYDLALEHAWTGVFLGASLGTDTTNFSIGDNEVEGGNMKYLQVGLKADLGYVLNRHELSEVWFDAFMFFGTHNDMETEGVLKQYDVETTGSASYGMGFEGAKRFYISDGLYSDVGLGLGYKIYTYDWVQSYSSYYSYSSYSEDYTLAVAYIYADPFAKLGYNISPNIEAFGKLGYTVPFGTTHQLSDESGNDVTNEELDSLGIEANGGVNISFGVTYHTNFASMFTKFFSSPASEICEEMK
jgi:hypothetical protein